MTPYRLLRAFLRFAVGIFFRQIEVVGRENIAPEGTRAVIFAGNHPNSLIDPVLILVHAGRVVHFAAKDVLFRSRFLRFFLDTMGAVPVARQADHGAGAPGAAPVDNAQCFTVLSRVLAGGRAMGIFPEGLSHDEAHIARLKTGAARIALDVAHRHDQPLDVVPCGLTYMNPKRFRSRVLIQFGPPIEIGTADADAFVQDERATVRALTERIETGLKALTVNATDWDTLRVLDAVRRLYQPPDISLWHRVELARRFNDHYPQVKDLPAVRELLGRVAAYVDRLGDLGLSDEDLTRTLQPHEVAARVVRHLLLLLVWLPLALPGFVLQAPLAAAIHWAGDRFSPRKDVIATTKLVMGLCAVPLLYAVLVAVAGWQFGLARALAVAGLLPLSGYAALRVFERGAAAQRALGTLVRMASLRTEIANLRAERDRLQDDVVRLVDKLRPADLEPLFARPVPLDPGHSPIVTAS